MTSEDYAKLRRELEEQEKIKNEIHHLKLEEAREEAKRIERENERQYEEKEKDRQLERDISRSKGKSMLQMTGDVGKTASGIGSLILYGVIGYMIYKVYSKSSLGSMSTWKPLSKQEIEILMVK